MKDWFGIYNGIDYLMLHNLYWLTMLPYYGIVSIGDSDADYWRNLAKHETNLAIAAYYNSFADFILYTDQNQRKITSTRTIPKGFEINYTAAEGIDLIPGFTAEKESCFDASINSDWVYEKTDYSVLPNSNTCFDAVPFVIPNTTSAIMKSNSTEVTTSLKSYSEPLSVTKINETSVTNQTISVESLPEKVVLQVAPNPNNGAFSVNLKHNIGSYSIKLYSINGIEVYSSDGNDDEIKTISITISGIYILNIYTDKEIFHRKIIINDFN